MVKDDSSASGGRRVRGEDAIAWLDKGWTLHKVVELCFAPSTGGVHLRVLLPLEQRQKQHE